MSMSDPISDLLTRIRNAAMVSKPWVDIPCSNQKIRILYILKEEHFNFFHKINLTSNNRLFKKFKIYKDIFLKR